MTTLETLLIGVVGSLAGVVVFLFRAYITEKDAHSKTKDQSSKLLFALLAKVKSFKREAPPKTESEWVDEPNTEVTRQQYGEAVGLARGELNGETRKLVQDFLAGVPTERPARYAVPPVRAPQASNPGFRDVRERRPTPSPKK